MGQAVEQRGRHLGIAEHARPFSECKISGDDDGGALIEPADEVEQKLAARLRERQIAQLVENDKVHAGQMLGEAALPTVAGLGRDLDVAPRSLIAALLDKQQARQRRVGRRVRPSSALLSVHFSV